MNKEKYWMDFLTRSPKMIDAFPREILRKRLEVSCIKEFSSVITGYNGKTDLYMSLNTNWQMKNNVFDCVFFEIDCYTEVGETVKDLNKMIKIVELFLSHEGIWYRRFFSGKKGVHYYIAFPLTHFHYFGNAVRKWAEQMPKVKRVNMQKYWFTGEIEMIETYPYDLKTIGNTKQLVRIPYTSHPITGLKCVESYGQIAIPMQERHENWLPEENLDFLKKIKLRDREPEVVDRSGDMIEFDFADSPKCIRNALKLMRGHLLHDQAWHLANFMITLGATDEEILACFTLDPKYNESLARQQIESIRQSALANMGCDKIGFIGLCNEKQRLMCPMEPLIDRYLFGENDT